MVNLVLDHEMHFMFVAKLDDDKYMMELIEGYDRLAEVTANDCRGRLHRYTYQN
jgi:hypothetical protein